VSTKHEIGRRSALRLIGTAPIAVAFTLGANEAAAAAEKAATAVKAAAAGKAYVPKFFNPQEWKTVRILVDMIIPKDERSGSATDAGVPEFMDYLMNDPTDTDLQRERRQTAMRGGLAWINSVSERRFGHGFAEATETERTAILDEIAYSKDEQEDEAEMREPRDLRVMVKHGPSFFNSFRDLTASGFWSSKMGVEDLGYMGNKFVAEWKGAPPEVLAKLGLSDT
jgi:gluconate 2-dehydrogenase subunit 3-like protein